VAGDEVAPGGDGLRPGLGVRARERDQLLVPGSQQVEQGELAVPGEDLVVPLQAGLFR
jgi:hypothetical protein